MEYFLIVFVLLLIVILVMGLYLAISLAYIKKRPDYPLENYKSPYLGEEYSEITRKWLDETDLRYEKVLSPYLYHINLMTAENRDNKKWIFLLHGVTNSHKYMIDIAGFYHRAGYSVAVWDSRAHGKSGGKTTTYGLYESFDAKAVIDHLRSKYGGDCKIGLHGISMGAGILLMYASHVRDDCSFYIADCPYSNFAEQVMYVSGRKLRLKGLPIKIVFSAGNFLARILFGFEPAKIDIRSKMNRVEKPVLFFNCRDDDYINPTMTTELYDRTSSEKKEVFWFDEGGHAGSFFSHPEEYERKVLCFIKEIGF